MHGPKTGNAAAGAHTQAAAILPADYPEWISQETCEIGLPHHQEASETLFPFARVLGHRKTRQRATDKSRVAPTD